MGIKSQRYNVYTKNGFMLNDMGMNIGTILSFTHHKQESFFGMHDGVKLPNDDFYIGIGRRELNGEQNSFYANIMHQ